MENAVEDEKQEVEALPQHMIERDALRDAEAVVAEADPWVEYEEAEYLNSCLDQELARVAKAQAALDAEL